MQEVTQTVSVTDIYGFFQLLITYWYIALPFSIALLFASRWFPKVLIAALGYQISRSTGAAEGDYTSYEKGSSAGASGKFRAPFDGTHGWYWRNRTDRPVTITVTATGDFEKFAALP